MISPAAPLMGARSMRSAGYPVVNPDLMRQHMFIRISDNKNI
jgi:hypothetical protein